MLTLVPIDKTILPYPVRLSFRRRALAIVNYRSYRRPKVRTLVTPQRGCAPGDPIRSLPCNPGDIMTICWCASDPRHTWPCPC